ncbi:MAG: dTDP-4-dehydrorhamnose 3,5-epimerase family protein [Verrucomicrobiota bacterium]|jgi:dTDP-4-dehydrorhamnose 3,5-epimerase|nr:dTDP-4-dehydrorhamnose 3,5-epimerase family protein [Verrucomicrobiota bacterium]
MKFIETYLSGVHIVDFDRREDERGWFARAWCREEFTAHVLSIDLAQCNLSYNAKLGTLRGLHFQIAPYAEAKLVGCVAGAGHDVVLGLRPDSPTFRQSFAVEFSTANGVALFMKKKF